MRHISTKTLANTLTDPKQLQEFSLEELIQCFFAVSQWMSFLHSNLICHGNLCPSNIIVDSVKKKLFMKEENLFNEYYKDSLMK